MLYHNDDLNVRILSVQRINNKQGTFVCQGRLFHAIVFRVRGSAKFILENGEKIRSMPRNVFYISSKMGYQVEYDEGETIAVHFLAKDQELKCENYSFPFVEKVYILFEKLLDSWNKKDNQLKLKSLFYELLSVLREEENNKETLDGALKVQLFFNENFLDCSVNVSKACFECGISESNLRVQFKKRFEKTPIEYLMELRVDYALRLLSFGSLSIEEVARRSGFSDVKYFSRVIKKKFNITPSKLAKTFIL